MAAESLRLADELPRIVGVFKVVASVRESAAHIANGGRN